MERSRKLRLLLWLDFDDCFTFDHDMVDGALVSYWINMLMEMFHQKYQNYGMQIL
jgi:hypothetical protein